MNQSTPRDTRGVLFGERRDQLVFVGLSPELTVDS